MIQDAIESYKLILRFTSVKTVNLQLIDDILGLLGFEIDNTIKSNLVNVVDGLSKEKGYNNLLEVARDPEFLSTVAALQKDASDLGVDALNLIKPKHKKNQILIEQREPDLIASDSVIKCPHCTKPFSIADSIGRDSY
jgi:hypothetical protein